jgi:DNA-binding response OmpR family regulator
LQKIPCRQEPFVHELSQACYQQARQDPAIPPERYRNLEAVLGLFARPRTLPRFSFPGTPPTVLIVEDEPGLVDMLRGALVGQGYPDSAIVAFAAAPEAVHYVHRRSVGVALVDIRLMAPGDLSAHYTSGLKVLDAVRDTSPGAVVVLASAYGTAAMVRSASLEHGASYYLGKPYRTSDVLSIVHWAASRLPEIRVPGGADAGRPLRGERILVVDDDRSICETLAAVLTGLGYRVQWALSGRDALDLHRDSPFDAVLLDLKMPGLDGLSVLERLTGLNPRPIVFVLTALGDEAIARKAAALGAQEFFVKPCDLPTLQVSLEFAFARAYKPDRPKSALSAETRPF